MTERLLEVGNLKDVIRNRGESNFIVGQVTSDDFENRLRSELDHGYVGSEQLFREFSKWYRVHSGSNPNRTIYEERFAIDQLSIYEITKGTTRVIWGVGQGDTEIIPQMWDLEKDGYSEAIAIDAVWDFLECYVQNARNASHYTEEGDPISLICYNAFFDQIKREHLNPQGRKYPRATNYLLSEVVGNLDQNQIFGMFCNLMNPGDFLVLGIGLLDDPHKALSRYEGSEYFEDHLTSLHGKSEVLRQRFPELPNLSWRFNLETESVEAWIGDVLLFSQKKYHPEKLETFAANFGFKQRVIETERHCAVVVFEKTT